MSASQIHFQPGSEAPELLHANGLASPESITAASEHADGWVFLTNHEDRIVAQVALWWNETPVLEGARVGSIGGFSASDVLSTQVLLDAAAARLAAAGCPLAVGPMNGNTWRRHRFVTESNGRGSFLLEPGNPETYPKWWRQAGFGELSRYTSSIIRLDGQSTVAPGLRERLERSGLVTRPLDPARFDDELRAIHELSLKSFSNNFLYSHLDQDAFLNAYRKVRDQVDSDLVRIAERGGIPCGFVFCIRDLEAEARGETPALIVKTLAVDPASRCAGLGSLLVDEAQRIGYEKGYAEAIHALQHETNTSLKITGRHHGEVFRNYALFSKRL